MSYHKIKIHKHSHTSPLKLLEETEEFIDSLAQNNKIMAAVELSDLLGAIQIQAKKLNLTIKDLQIMNEATVNAFQTIRESFNLYDYLKTHAQSIKEFGLGFIQIKIDNYNYNFYTNLVNKFPNYDMPHNHQTDFISEIIKGELIEKVYEIIPGEHHLSCVCGNPENRLNDVNYIYKETLTHREGSLYFRDKNTFHSVFSDNAITKVLKIGNKQDAFAFGEVTPYISNKTEEELWTLIRTMI